MTINCILAAGNSSRMGQAKMLLPYKGKPFLQNIIEACSHLKNQQTIVVTGFYHDLIKATINTDRITLLQNTDWEEGMGSSIRSAMQYILQHFPTAQQVFIMVCDQPHISANLLQQMIDSKIKTGNGIVACKYNNTEGTPALFDKKYFTFLAKLQGKEGAKKLLQQFNNDVELIDFPEGAIDIDTPEDYEKLKSSFN